MIVVFLHNFSQVGKEFLGSPDAVYIQTHPGTNYCFTSVADSVFIPHFINIPYCFRPKLEKKRLPGFVILPEFVPLNQLSLFNNSAFFMSHNSFHLLFIFCNIRLSQGWHFLVVLAGKNFRIILILDSDVEISVAFLCPPKLRRKMIRLR